MEHELIVQAKEERKAFIADLRNKFFAGEATLSYSALSNFRKSPKHFIDYKMNTAEQTDAMKLGSLVHLLVLEPQKFDEKFLIAVKCDRRTKEGKQMYSEFLEALGNRSEISFEDYEKAQLMADAVKNNPVSKNLLDQCKQKEVKIEFTHQGLKFIGFIDGLGESIIDIKICVDADPKKFQRDITNMGYWLQGGIYTFAVQELKPYFLIAVDRTCNVSVHKIMDDFLSYGQQQFDVLCNQFIQCLESNSFDQSYEFRSVIDQGYFPVDKPPYAI